MTPSEKYTAAAYLVVFVGLLVYVLIIASKLQRLQRELGELARIVLRREQRLGQETARHHRQRRDRAGEGEPKRQSDA